MPYLIDGHNLIPKLTGMALDEIDDENRLVEMLQEFCRIQRKEVEVFFDNAPAGQPRARNFGNVIARFIRQGTTADDAIHAKLVRLGRDARNWIVVSSDRAVQASARAARAQFMASERFAQVLRQALAAAESPGEKSGDPVETLDDQEVEDWLKLFEQHKRKRSG